jgi:5-formaminoimidazole-4-carboxamide-1-beta-D-ribofuranosyl 5'-monophosphate synthetase
LEKEQKQKLREERLKRQNEKRNSADSRWTAIYENNGNPYHRVFQPRYTKIGERIEEELKESLKHDNL